MHLVGYSESNKGREAGERSLLWKVSFSELGSRFEGAG